MPIPDKGTVSRDIALLLISFKYGNLNLDLNCGAGIFLIFNFV
jgi:ribosomal protein L1